MSRVKSTFLAAVALILSPVVVNAVPITLEGMGQTSVWTDFEDMAGEMPANPWGTSDIDGADRVGIYVEYANGLTGSATYSGVAGGWGGCCSNLPGGSSGVAPDTATGFFVAGAGDPSFYGNLHGLDNAGFVLPMAWAALSNAFTNNFDLDYTESFGSNWRANTSGWDSVVIALYSSTARVDVPEPGTLALLGIGLIGMGLARRRKV